MHAQEKTYLAIPFDDLPRAKREAGRLDSGEPALGFDKEQKLWFAKPGAELERIKNWLPGTGVHHEEADSPLEQFAEALMDAGFELGGLPEMDGKTHRVAVEGDTGAATSGVYVGHLDGFPNGWYENHRAANGRVTWKPNSPKQDPAVLAQLRAQTAQKKLAREQQTRETHEKAAIRYAKEYAGLPACTSAHPYLMRKGLPALEGIRQNAQGQLIVPVRDLEGNIRTLERINADGSKLLAAGGEKSGHFFVVGGELQNGRPLLLAEGLSTAASISLALHYPVVMTVDAGNMVTVAEKLHQTYPNSPVLILGDDDYSRSVNKGQLKAEEAAQRTGGRYLLPVFTAEERQQGLTDFNDLHHTRGLDALAAQIRPAFEALPRPTLSEEHPMNDNTPPPTDLADYGPLAEQVFEQDQEDVSLVTFSAPEAVPVMSDDDRVPPGDTVSDASAGLPTPEVIPTLEENATPEPPVSDDDAARAASPRAQEPQPAPNATTEEEKQDTAEPPEAGPATSTEEAIHIDTGNDAYRATPIDLDALMQHITHEVQGRTVKYLYAGNDAFVDHGNRITMANTQSSQNDAMILAALLVSREYYKGRIELTGSEAFKQQAIGLIAAYNLDITMKHPHQQLLLDEAKKALANEPAPGDRPTPIGTPVAAIIPEHTAPSPTLPPELQPTVLPQEGPQNASRQETEKGLTGTLLGYGPARYQFDDSESHSYYVHLRTGHGERYIWGKELAGAVRDSGMKTGEVTTLTWLGNKEVTVLTKVRDEQGKVVVDNQGVEQTREIAAKRNQWEMKPAIDAHVLVSEARQAVPPASLQAYEMRHFAALQQQVLTLAAESGITLPPVADSHDLVWFKPNGEGAPPPTTRPTHLNLPAVTQEAGTLLMKTLTDDNQLKLLLVKGLGDYVQGVVQYQGAYHPVLGKLCSRDNGSRYLSLNALTPDGPQAIGYGNAVNHEAGAHNAFVFRLKGENERLYAPLADPEKCPPALHKQLGFTHDYVPPSQTPQPRDTDRVEPTTRPTPPPRPGM